MVSRSSRSSSLIRPASVLSAPGHHADLDGRGRVGAGVELAAGQPVRHGGHVDRRADQAAGQPVGHQQAHREQHHSEQGEQQPRPADAGRSAPRR